MNSMELTLSLEALEKQMNLPANVKLAAVYEQYYHQVVFRFIVDGIELPDTYQIPNLSSMGEFFANPEKYKYEDKATVGDVPAGETTAPVDAVP